jgi:hypothetical protein
MAKSGALFVHVLFLEVPDFPPADSPSRDLLGCCFARLGTHIAGTGDLCTGADHRLIDSVFTGAISASRGVTA